MLKDRLRTLKADRAVILSSDWNIASLLLDVIDLTRLPVRPTANVDHDARFARRNSLSKAICAATSGF